MRLMVHLLKMGQGGACTDSLGRGGTQRCNQGRKDGKRCRMWGWGGPMSHVVMEEERDPVWGVIQEQ